MVVLSNIEKVHKVELDLFVNTDTCKQNQTWHKHNQVQSQVQHRGGKAASVCRIRRDIRTFPSNSDLPVKVAWWRWRGQTDQPQPEFRRNFGR